MSIKIKVIVECDGYHSHKVGCHRAIEVSARFKTMKLGEQDVITGIEPCLNDVDWIAERRFWNDVGSYETRYKCSFCNAEESHRKK